MSQALEQLKLRLRDINALRAATAVLDWDQQTFMPPGASNARAQHVGVLSRLAHETMTSDEVQKLTAQAAKEVEPGSLDADYVRVFARELANETRLPSSHVERFSIVTSQAQEVWVKARIENKFTDFAPVLEEIFDLCRERANLLGAGDHIYDSLTDLYEEGATKAGWDVMFDGIREPLVQLVREIKESGRQEDDSFLYGEWPDADQARFTEKLAREIGFDFNCGRQDTAPHPFCTNFSVSDVRLTTRFKPYLGSAIFGTLHEAGHGMYEQGSPIEWDLSPLAGGVSLGFHESQSRTWENIVGRSRAFWQRYLPDLQVAFPALAGIELDRFYRAINRVEPTFIRVEADEVTYNLHIMVRFELECELLSGSLAVKDLPEAWNAKYQSYLGITPDSDSDGCLQDVHWSAGLVGYFPTYSMGNILSYQIWNALRAELGDVDALIAEGKFAPILGWLQAKVYRQGKRHRPADLLKSITGQELNPADYLAGIGDKYRAIYGIG